MLRKILAATAALVLLVGIGATRPAPADAYAPLAGHWALKTIYFCFDSDADFPYQSMKNTLSYGFQRWNTLGSVLDIEPQTDPLHQLCNVHVRYDTIGPAGQTSISVSNGLIYSATIHFNKPYGSDFWWYTATQQCYVGSGDGCHMDAYTIAIHEMGHAIGLGHNTSPDTDQRCRLYWFSNDGNWYGGCWSYGQSIMHWNSGAEFINGAAGGGYRQQGYRHATFSSDDISAYHQAY